MNIKSNVLILDESKIPDDILLNLRATFESNPISPFKPEFERIEETANEEIYSSVSISQQHIQLSPIPPKDRPNTRGSEYQDMHNIKIGYQMDL